MGFGITMRAASELVLFSCSGSSGLSVSATATSLHIFNPNDLPIRDQIVAAPLSCPIVDARGNAQFFSTLESPMRPVGRVKRHHDPVSGLARTVERQPFRMLRGTNNYRTL